MKRILIANRGEIAMRIITTCKRIGIQTVAVYSDADRDLPYVREADESHPIGDSPVRQSYLDMEKLLQIAIKNKVDAIHPGYGLLSENCQFAQKCLDQGLTFIGPNPQILAKMGDKIKALEMVNQASVPILPGSNRALASLEDALVCADEIGYPVMLKASAGGGGIGMFLCRDNEALIIAYDATKKRAKAYFGNDELFLEKYIERARHIEIQIFADHEGNIVHLFDRNCSTQRRNQKVIEEAPSPHLSDSTRERMYEAAIAVAKAVQYENAGTIEFLIDEDERFYFLEMNTRIQVEHPVTEEITGIDLIEWQISVAMKKTLPIAQREITPRGHAMEVRIYAEDPNTFRPSPGQITEMNWPMADRVRIESGYEAGNVISHFYDSMIAKVIFHEQTRRECILAAKRFLEGTRIGGIKTNIPFLLEVLDREDFCSGHYDTNMASP